MIFSRVDLASRVRVCIVAANQRELISQSDRLKQLHVWDCHKNEGGTGRFARVYPG